MDGAETVGAALSRARERLRPSLTASLDAQLLMAHVLGRPRVSVLARPEWPLTGEQAQGFRLLVERRAGGEPVAYLTGSRQWMDMDLWVGPEVLVPRPETELLVERAARLAHERGARNLADVGTGSGAVALGLVRLIPGSRVVATDISGAALEVAERNVRRYGEGRVRLVQGDLLEAVIDCPDVVVANLPYLSDTMMADLDADVRYEPRLALHGGETGLELYERLLGQMVMRGWQVPSVMEIDPRQAEQAVALVGRLVAGARVMVERDYAGLERIVVVEP